MKFETKSILLFMLLKLTKTLETELDFILSFLSRSLLGGAGGDWGGG